MKKSSPSPFLLFLPFVSILVETTLADPRSDTVKLSCETKLENNNTIYVPNCIATMVSIGNMIKTSGFGEAVVGSGPDANYGLAQCYGDLSSLDCVLCYTEARTVLPQCFPYNGGRIYLDGCFMRVENYSFFQEITGPGDKSVCGNATRKGPGFVQSARQAVLDAVAAAPNRGGYSKSTVHVKGSRNESAYVLANCWRTLNATSCRTCLENASASMIGCLPWSEGRAIYAGCFMRYSDTNFLNAEQSNGHLEGSIAVMVAILSSVAVLILGVAIGVYVWKHRRIQKKRRGANDAVKLAKTLHDSSLNFKYSTLERATRSFNDANKLGQGGFGTVYKVPFPYRRKSNDCPIPISVSWTSRVKTMIQGVLPDGREIAVKRLFYNNRHRAADFYNEVNTISILEHKNLVRLLGCSCSGPESLLVYEFLPNKGLDCFLFDPSRGELLTWDKRFKIIKGTAEGLVYLHENPNVRVIHRDIKASNILLDSKLQPKIADFGLARSFQEDKSHISTAIAGTVGYMAPEYLTHGQLTEKADVYSFGVLLLEIVTGLQNNRITKTEYSDGLVTSAWKHFQLGTTEKLYDPNLGLYNYNHIDNIKEEILWVVHVALLCTQEAPSLRPSMSKTLQMLLKRDEQLPAPTNPPFMDVNTMGLSDSCGHKCHWGSTSSLSVATVSDSFFYPR